VQGGYYYIWYYADAPGRHRSLFATNNGYSNAVIIDVFAAGDYIKPNHPTPKEQCEKKPYCHWVNNKCLCTQPPLTEKQKCEKSVNCAWVNGRCNCFMPQPEPEPEPMPGPVITPYPYPEPEPFIPAPDPIAQCPDGCLKFKNYRICTLANAD
jgi:hypothetical protein